MNPVYTLGTWKNLFHILDNWLFDTWQEKGIVLISPLCPDQLWPTQPIRRVLGVLFLGESDWDMKLTTHL
jgi:hypothetical protein